MVTFEFAISRGALFRMVLPTAKEHILSLGEHSIIAFTLDSSVLILVVLVVLSYKYGPNGSFTS